MKGRLASLTILLVLLPSGGCRPARSGLRLEIVSGRGVVVWETGVEVGQRFDVAFTHSREGCRWTQHYQMGPREDIEQLGSTFPCFGAGMPLEASNPAATVRTDRGYLVTAVRRLAEVRMMNSKAARITFEYGDQRVLLSGLFDEFEPFTLRLSRSGG